MRKRGVHWHVVTAYGKQYMEQPNCTNNAIRRWLLAATHLQHVSARHAVVVVLVVSFVVHVRRAQRRGRARGARCGGWRCCGRRAQRTRCGRGGGQRVADRRARVHVGHRFNAHAVAAKRHTAALRAAASLNATVGGARRVTQTHGVLAVCAVHSSHESDCVHGAPAIGVGFGVGAG